MVVLIVTIAVVGSILRARYKAGAHRSIADDPEAQRLRDEVKQLKDRLAVLEQITIEKENSLERQIEALRDR
jgi:uncharacterized protein YlxW (UPF0749 family)